MRIIGCAALAAVALTGCGEEQSGPSGPSGPNVTVETSRAVTDSIGTAGGTLVATSSAGVSYTFTVPAGALPSPTAITMTPVAAIGNLDVTELAGAVDFQPSGLVLAKPATLLIANAGPPAEGLVPVGFTYAGDADSVALDLAQDSSGELTLLVSHFSGGGVAFATMGQIQALASSTTPSSLTQFYLNQLAIAAATSPRDFPTELDIMRQWMDKVIVPQLTNAASDVQLLFAVGDYNRWLNTTIALATSGSDPVFQPERDRAGQAAAPKLQQAIADNNQECLANQDISFAGNVLFWQTVAEGFGIATAANGLDRRSVLDGLCIQVVVTDVHFPDPAAANQTQSLDLLAGVRFGANPLLANMLFRWELDITGSTADGVVQGLSASDGSFTAVITPTGQAPLIVLVTACLAAPEVPYPDVCGSDILSRNFTATALTGAYDGPQSVFDSEGNDITNIFFNPARWWLFPTIDSPSGVYFLEQGNPSTAVPQIGTGVPRFFVTLTGNSLAVQPPTQGITISGTVAGGQMSFSIIFPNCLTTSILPCTINFTGSLTIPVQ